MPATGFADFTGGFSSGVWVYPTSTASWSRFFDFGNGGTSNNIFLARNGTTSTLNYTVRIGSSSQQLEVANAIELNKWQYFSVVQQANGCTTLYKNGVSIGTGSVQVPANLTRTLNYVGKSNVSSDPLFAGQMSNLSIWNRPLSAGEVARGQRPDNCLCRHRPGPGWLLADDRRWPAT